MKNITLILCLFLSALLLPASAALPVAGPAPVAVVDSPCGPNPYDNYVVTPMPWILCQPGYVLDMACVLELQLSYDAQMAVAVSKAKRAWNLACGKLQTSLDLAWTTYQACGGASSTNPQCKINYDQANAAAYTAYSKSIGATASTLAGEIASITSDILTKMHGCCIED